MTYGIRRMRPGTIERWPARARPISLDGHLTRGKSESGLFERLRRLASMIVDRDVVGQPRYRAWERRHVRAAARAGTAVLVVVLLFDALAMLGDAPTISLLNVPLALAGLVMHIALTRRSGPRRNPTGAALLLGIMALTTSLLPLGLVPEAGPILLAYVPLVIVASALFIPWSTVRHITWLAVCLGMVFGFVLSPFAAGMSEAAVGDLVTIAIDSVLVSMGGHLVLQRQRRSMFLQRMQLRGLNQLAARQGAELRSLAEELRAAARIDPLTGVANRLRLEEDLEMVTRRDFDRAGGAALMIDIDRFKLYNDHHGHFAGDAVLRRVAAELAESARTSDRVYRFGGEEFLVLLPGASIIDALAVAERQRAAVEQLAIPTERPGRDDPDEVVTVSIGVARMTHDADGPVSRPDTWLKAADAALYESKTAGRNRVTVARDVTDEAVA
jgi:diguanylate cyclase (GGDEF)-like protein